LKSKHPLKRPFGQILWFGQQADSLPVTCHRRRVYIMPTGYGLLFLGILLAMLLGSINYNNNLGFLLVFLLGSIALVSMLHTYRNLLNLRVLSIAAPPVFAGGVVRLEMIAEAGPRNRSALGFRIEKEPFSLNDIPAGAEGLVEIHGRAQERGVFKPGRIMVWSRYPLGLFRTWAILKPDISCIVYPKPVSGPLNYSSGRKDDGISTNTHRRGVDDFAGLTTYQPGDPINRISWKSLSRGHGLFVREFTGTGGMTVMVDYAALPGQDMEWRLSRMCDMVLKAHAMNAEYGLRLPDQVIPPEKGDRHRHRCLKALALYGEIEK
jgi:uncharacterized protein (DUF58 family)